MRAARSVVVGPADFLRRRRNVFDFLVCITVVAAFFVIGRGVGAVMSGEEVGEAGVGSERGAICCKRKSDACDHLGCAVYAQRRKRVLLEDGVS